MNTTRSISVVVFLCVAWAGLLCQAQPTSSVRNQAAVTPGLLAERLQSADEKTRQNTSKELGLSTPIGNAPCTDFDEVESKSVQLVQGVESRLLEIHSQVCEAIFLVPMVQLEQRWITIPPITLWTKYSTPSYKLDNLIKTNEKEIIVSNITVDAGTGILQRNLMIYRVSEKGIRIVFDRPESIHYSVPTQTPRGSSSYDDDEASTSSFPGTPRTQLV